MGGNVSHCFSLDKAMMMAMQGNAGEIPDWWSFRVIIVHNRFQIQVTTPISPLHWPCFSLDLTRILAMAGNVGDFHCRSLH